MTNIKQTALMILLHNPFLCANRMPVHTQCAEMHTKYNASIPLPWPGRLRQATYYRWHLAAT